MAKLDLARAPPVWVPRLFLLTTPLWGVIAGLMLAHDGAAALQSRWALPTLALTHVFTLGVLGNAMFGSLLQFLPAAAGVRVRGGAGASVVLHVLLNAGTVALVAGFRGAGASAFATATVLLAAAFGLLAAMTLPGLPRGAGPASVRGGIGFALVAALATATLGIAMARGLAGLVPALPVLPWADVHATWGVLGWALALVASVARVVVPMFQGVPVASVRAHVAALTLAAIVLVTGSALAVNGRPHALRSGAAAVAGVFVIDALWRQWRTPPKRNPELVLAWRAGLLALLAAAAVLAANGAAVLVGVLALGVGLPLLVLGMQLEIVAFLGWIELHRRCGRGTRLPPVQHLLPAATKTRVLRVQMAAGALLVVAALWPGDVAARLAGSALAAAHAVAWFALAASVRRTRRWRLEESRA